MKKYKNWDRTVERSVQNYVSQLVDEYFTACAKSEHSDEVWRNYYRDKWTKYSLSKRTTLWADIDPNLFDIAVDYMIENAPGAKRRRRLTWFLRFVGLMIVSAALALLAYQHYR